MNSRATQWVIKTRVLIAITVPAVVITLTLMIYFLLSQTQLIEDQLQENGSQLSNHIALMSEFSLISGNTTSLKATLNTLIKDSNIITIEVMDKNNNIVLALKNSNIEQANTNLVFTAPVHITLEEMITLDPYDELISSNAQTEIGSVNVNISLIAIESKRKNLILISVLLSVLTLIISLLLGHRLVRSIVGPITSVIEAVQKLRMGNYQVRIKSTAPDVLGKLARGIDQLAAKLELARHDVNRQMLELTQERQNADHANAAKSRFLALMSHELRDPLNAINANLEVLDDFDIPAYQRRFIDVSKVSLEQLLHLIQNILDFSQAEAGKLTLSPRLFDLKTVIENVLSVHRAGATNKGLDLSITYSVDSSLTDVKLLNDPTRIQQILINLLGNAIKYTNDGSVYLAVSLKRVDENKAMLSVEVRDTGVGIPSEQLDNVFELFEQVASPSHRAEGGSGLGLAITKLVSDTLGGKITVFSEIMKGSTFTFEVSIDYLMSTDSETNKTEPEYPVFSLGHIDTDQNKRILLVEDNPCNQIAVKGLMKNIGIDIDIASNGIEGIELFTKIRHDLIFVDCFMPGMDGLEFAKTVRSIEKKELITTDKRCLLIAVTAWSQNEMKEKCFNAGIDDIIIKPFSKFDLYARVKTVMTTDVLLMKQYQDDNNHK